MNRRFTLILVRVLLSLLSGLGILLQLQFLLFQYELSHYDKEEIARVIFQSIS